MRAAYIEEHGPPSVIRYGELPDPRPGPTDVLVDVDAVAVDPVDTFVRSGAWRTPLAFPFVIGRDLVGTVAEAGPGAPGFAPGDRVWSLSMGHEGRQGPSAERAVVPADRLYRLPEDADPLDVLAVAHPAATAHLALFTHGRLRPGETVVVLGAAGNVGGAMTVMAVNAGARVIAVASADDAAYCRDLGAARTIDYRDPDASAQIATACGDGADLLLDTSGRNDLEQTVGLLARRGRIVVFSGMTARPVLPVASLYLQDRSVTGFVISHATTTELAEAAHHVARLTAAGLLRPRHRTVLPLSEAAEAHRLLESGQGSGRRLLLRVHEHSRP